MRHNACRRALVDGDLNPAVAEHLERCAACRQFSADLAMVSDHAQSLAPPPPPEGLADRVLNRVRAEGDTSGGNGAGVVDLDAAARRERRTPLLATTSIAAVLILLVGVLAVLPSTGDGGDPTDPLLVAAERTAGVQSARVRLSGTTSMTARLPAGARPALPDIVIDEIPEFDAFEPPPPPDVSGLPPEDAAEILADFRASMEAAQRDHAEYAAQLRAQYEEFRRDDAAAFARVKVPEQYSFDATVQGEGSVDFSGGAMRLGGSIEIVEASPSDLGDVPGDFAAVVVGDETFYQGPDGEWIAIPGASGPLGLLVLDPEGVTRLLSGADSEAVDLGTTDVDGQAVRRYRFGVGSSVFGETGAAPTRSSAEVWIGADDHVVRRLTTESSTRHEHDGMRIEMTTTMSLELFDFGAGVEVEAPEVSARASSPLGPAAIFFPFDDGFSVSFHYGATAPQQPNFDVPDLPEPPPPPPPPEPPPPPSFEYEAPAPPEPPPSYEDPAYEEPEEPEYQEPAYEEPAYEEPADGEPADGEQTSGE